jgi:Domain of unknown function (DUF4258)
MAILYSAHALKRIFQRGLTLQAVARAMEASEVIAHYPDDQPYPSKLVLGWDGGVPMHVVAALTEQGDTVVITAYVPEPGLWDETFKRKLP